MMFRSSKRYPHDARRVVSRFATVAALLIAWSLVAAPTQARPSDLQNDEASDEADAQERAARLTARAEQLYLAQDFVAALDSYREAYLAVSAPELLFNLGQCHRKLGQFEEAAVFFHVYLQVEPASPYRDMVEGLVAESRIQHSLAAAQYPAPPPPPEQVVPPVPPHSTARTATEGPTPRPPLTEERRWTRRQRRWAWALGGVALVAGGTAALATTLRNRPNEPGTTSSASLGVVDWR